MLQSAGAVAEQPAPQADSHDEIVFRSRSAHRMFIVLARAADRAKAAPHTPHRSRTMTFGQCIGLAMFSLVVGLLLGMRLERTGTPIYQPTRKSFWELTDNDLAPIQRTWANIWQAKYFEALTEVHKANKGANRLRRKLNAAKKRRTATVDVRQT